MHAPFVIHISFECALVPSTDNSYKGSDIEKYQNHIVWSYCYKLICLDELYCKPYKTYFGEDAMAKFSNNIINESKYFRRVIEKKKL